jgi:hypothetical protein
MRQDRTRGRDFLHLGRTVHLSVTWAMNGNLDDVFGVWLKAVIRSSHNHCTKQTTHGEHVEARTEVQHHWASAIGIRFFGCQLDFGHGLPETNVSGHSAITEVITDPVARQRASRPRFTSSANELAVHAPEARMTFPA